MRAGLIVSATAHAALLVWGLVSLHSPAPIDASDIEQIPVDFVEIGDETKIQKGSPVEKVVAETPAPKPEPKPTPPPPPPPPPPVETPTPPAPTPEPATPPPPQEPAPAPMPSPDAPPPPPEPTRVASADIPTPRLSPSAPKPTPKEKPRPEPQADPSQLLDRNKLEQTIASVEPTPQDTVPTVGSVNGSTQASLTANELDALRARLVRCWNPPIGWSDPSEVRVVLMLNLNPDGTLAGQPQVLESPQGQFSLTAPESAMRAVRRCQPYDLPADKYDAWKEVKVTFDPKDMSGL